MTKILITGGLGFIGHNLVRHLAKNRDNQIFVVDNFKREGVERNLVEMLLLPNVDIYRKDVRNWFDVQSLPVADVILHYAGNSGIPWSVADPYVDFLDNASTTILMLEKARKDGSAFIQASTNRVYPVTLDRDLYEDETRYVSHAYPLGINEAFPLEGQRSPYGASKLAADFYVQEYFHTYGVRGIVNRMGAIYGEGQYGSTEQGWVGYMCRVKQEKKYFTIFGNGKQVRDPMYIGDLLRLIELEINHVDLLAGNVFNVGGGLQSVISVLELAQHLDIDYSFSERRIADMDWYISDTRLVQTLTGWKPKVPILDGVSITMDWLKSK